jgi:hypothetical protein
MGSLKEIGWEGMDWIHVVKYREKWWAVVNVGMNLLLPYTVGNCVTS